MNDSLLRGIGILLSWKINLYATLRLVFLNIYYDNEFSRAVIFHLKNVIRG